MIIAALVAAFVAGALVTLQTGSDARLKDALGAPSAGGDHQLDDRRHRVDRRGGRDSRPVPPLTKVAGAPWSAWVGGLCGAVYAVMVVLLAHQSALRR